jgi:SagB-type dehydrogenase family enzyme
MRGMIVLALAVVAVTGCECKECCHRKGKPAPVAVAKVVAPAKPMLPDPAIKIEADGSIALPRPRHEGGMPLLTALTARHSTREFSPRPLGMQTLSDLLYAADGVNRADSGKRTAPTAMNKQEIDVYVALAEGLFRFEPKEHRLAPVVKDDLRATTGKQDYVGTAPLNLVYVANYAQMDESKPEDRAMYSAADTGFIGQNVYLFCASEGLGAVIRAYVDREALGAAMKLGPEQHVVLAQTVGYPAK